MTKANVVIYCPYNLCYDNKSDYNSLDLHYFAKNLVFLVSSAGLVLVKYKLIDQDAISSLSQLSKNLFLPALLFISLGGSLSIENLKNTWTLPIIGVFFCLLCICF